MGVAEAAFRCVHEPTSAPTPAPSMVPTNEPTLPPTVVPTPIPTSAPTSSETGGTCVTGAHGQRSPQEQEPGRTGAHGQRSPQDKTNKHEAATARARDVAPRARGTDASIPSGRAGRHGRVRGRRLIPSPDSFPV